METLINRAISCFCVGALFAISPLQAADKDVIVINTPDVSVTNTPDVVIANTPSNPVPVQLEGIDTTVPIIRQDLLQLTIPTGASNYSRTFVVGPAAGAIRVIEQITAQIALPANINVVGLTCTIRGLDGFDVLHVPILLETQGGGLATITTQRVGNLSSRFYLEENKLFACGINLDAVVSSNVTAEISLSGYEIPSTRNSLSP
jgi:hypothetical protein